jgi:hypothetical protein
MAATGVDLGWANDDLILYHGCTDDSLQPQNPSGIAVGVAAHGIDPTVGAPTPDFGLGFYTTTWLDQARVWANQRARQLARSRARSLGRPAPHAVVLQIALKRNDLAELDALVFTNEKVGYWPFVTYCRAGGQPHGRGSPRLSYDVVYGPVSLASDVLVIKDSDQVSFHTDRAVAKIPLVSVVATGKPFL